MPQTLSPELVTRLEASGKRVTPDRELLLGIIERQPHLDAEKIYRVAQKSRPQIGLATVYRTLSLLRELGIIRATDLGENHFHYEVCADEHIHLVCTHCGAIADIPVPPSVRHAADAEGFEVRETHFELYGTCRNCRQGAARHG